VKILVDISHPAHVHFFRFAINEWQRRGHQIRIVARDKDLTLPLLESFSYEYSCLSKARKGVIGLGLELLEHELRLLGIIREFRPDVMLNIGGTFIVHVGKLLNTPTIVFSDTENATVSNQITYPFAGLICTPSCYKGDLGRKQVRYEGYQELAYTHPNWFRPNSNVLNELGLARDEKLFLIRFVAWQSGHDVMKIGFSLEGKRRLVESLKQQGRVVITSERSLPEDLEPLRMRVSPTKVHDLLAFSTLYIGESATMASESAILGTPFIFVSPVGRGYTDEEEKRYGLGYTFKPSQAEHAIQLALELAGRENLRQEWQAKRQQLLHDKIDVTAWLVKFVEGYPESFVEYQQTRRKRLARKQ
jgi:predicted glycosyltransferase